MYSCIITKQDSDPSIYLTTKLPTPPTDEAKIQEAQGSVLSLSS